MKLFEIFSKRQKRLRGEIPDVYRHEIIPPELRVQVFHIWMDVWGKIQYERFAGPYGHAYEAYEFIHNKLCSEYGVFALGDGNEPYDRVFDFLLSTEETEKVLDVIEVSFRCIDPEVRDDDNGYFVSNIAPDRAIDKLNYRFREHGVGYQYESGQIIKVDSQFIHSEVMKPTLIFLSDPMYKGANEEFLKAHEHYRKRTTKIV